MRNELSLGLAALLMACGNTSTSDAAESTTAGNDGAAFGSTANDDTADAAAQRTRRQAPPQRPITPDLHFEQGGMAGCFDPNLSGYERTAAESIGGVPCDTPRQSAMNGAGSSGAASIVGIWVMQGGACASGDPIAFEQDGRYATGELDAVGRWSLSGDRLTVVSHEVEDETGASLGTEHRMRYRVTRVNANEIRLDADRYRRCPANGAEPWHPQRRR